MTSKRAAILQILRESEGHLTAEEIFARAKTRFPGMAFATVYNNLHALEEAGADALGLNCGFGPEIMLEHLKALRPLTELPLLITPNAGLPRREDGRTVYDVRPDDFAAVMERIVSSGANAVGGCCGTTPEHMSALIKKMVK